MGRGLEGASGRGKFFTDLWWILVGELYLMRLSWFWYLFQMTFTPLVFMAFFVLFAGSTVAGVTFFVVTGSLAQGLATSSMLTLGQEIGGLKDHNAFEHYAMLPISKVAFLLGMATRAVLFALPSVFVLLVVGVLAFGLPVHVHPLAAVVLFLAGYSMAGLGAFIGFYSPTGNVASLATQIVQPLIVLFAPVYLPVERLPAFLRVTSAFIPTTYVARALRDTLSGAVTPRTYGDVGILLAFTAASLWLAARRLDWRAGEA